MLKIMDTHCHLASVADQTGEKVDAVIEQGLLHIQKIVHISTSMEDINIVLATANHHKNIYAAVGIHPLNASETIDYTILESHLNNENVIGIGETGLDYYRVSSNIDIQKKSFIKHIEMAVYYKKTLVVHMRNAENDTYACLAQYSNIQGVMHCFTGSIDFAKKALDLGMYISFSGIVTFNNAGHLLELARYLPYDRIVIETDAPYLAPTPMRGQVNRPEYVKYTLKFLADLRGETLETFAHNVYCNSLRCFGLSDLSNNA